MQHAGTVVYLAAVALTLGACGDADAAKGGLADPTDCVEVEAFAERLVDIGITYDYEPSSGPADLAAMVDAVVMGTLTDAAASTTTAERGADAFVGYEIAVAEVLAGEAPDRDTVTVSMPFNPNHLDADAYESAVVEGAPVIVFPWSHPEAPGGFVASAMEGFMTTCEDGGLLGWVGSGGGWAEVETLGDVARAVRTLGQAVAPDVDGHLECAGNEAAQRVAGRVDGNGDYDRAGEAIEKELAWLLDRFPPGARLVADGPAGAIVTDGREVAETRALEGDDGRWYTNEVNWCIE